MRFIIPLLTAPFFLIQAAQSAPALPRPSAFPADSVGVERKNGRTFVLHRVDQGQTLYGVARRYKSTVDAIKAANPDLTESVRYDQLVRVPVADAAPSRREQKDAEKAARRTERDAERSPTTTAAEPKSAPRSDRYARTAPVPANGLHLVETGQTLYSLAVRYSVTMADLRRWNDLDAEGVKVGQSLIVSEKTYLERNRSTDSADKASPARTIGPAPAKLETKPIITPEPLPTPGSKPKQKTTESKPADPKPKSAEARPTERAEPKPVEAKPVERAEPKPAERAEPKATEPRSDNEPVMATTTRKGARVTAEIGFADQIDGNESTKYLALHRSAPVGTLVQVRNDITNQSLYVKVIGRLPDTGINNQVLIRLSGRAFAKLSPNGQRFRAEVSYSN